MLAYEPLKLNATDERSIKSKQIELDILEHLLKLNDGNDNVLIDTSGSSIIQFYGYETEKPYVYLLSDNVIEKVQEKYGKGTVCTVVKYSFQDTIYKFQFHFEDNFSIYNLCSD